MGKRFGEDKAQPVKRVRVPKTDAEKELLDVGNERNDAEDASIGLVERQPYPERKVTALSDLQIDAIVDRVVLGESIAKIAREFKVGVNPLAKKVKVRLGMLYLKRWQQSVAFDCLRAEKLLNIGMVGAIEGDSRWGKLALDVLKYRADVLGFNVVAPKDETIRVAGLSADEVFEKVIARL